MAMKRREFLKTVGAGIVVASLPPIPNVLSAPAHPMLPKSFPYWRVHLSSYACMPEMDITNTTMLKLMEEYGRFTGHASYGWCEWWFKNKAEGQKFVNYVKETYGAKPWDSCPEQLTAIEPLSKEQYDYWQRMLFDTGGLNVDYRCAVVGDEEEIRIVERADDETEEEFISGYDEKLTKIYRNLYREIKGDPDWWDLWEDFAKKIRPHIDGPELEQLSFSLWEDMLYHDDGWKDYVGGENYGDNTCKEVRERFTWMR